MGPAQAVILGAVTAVGGGTIRDMMLQRVPTVLRAELYAIPALVGATITVAAQGWGPVALVPVLAAAACFVIRLVGVRLDLHAPRPRGFHADGA